MRVAAVLAVVCIAGCSEALTQFHVNCATGFDENAGTAAAPFKTVARAQAAVRSARNTRLGHTTTQERAAVQISGLCELESTLTLDSTDSNVDYVGTDGAMLSGGTQLNVPPSVSDATSPIQIDLTKYNFSASTLGKLSGRGYSGGSACINVYAFEPSGAELFYRPAGPASAAGARSAGSTDAGTGCRLARWPNANPGVPASSDWAKITKVETGQQVVLGGATATQLSAWAAEVATGDGGWTHGLWSWNWADSHRPILGVYPANGSVAVGNDDMGNRDTSPIKVGSASGQGGNVYVYNLKSELDAPGEYYIDRATATLWFIPPPAAAGAGAAGTYHLSRLPGAVVSVGPGVANVSFRNLEIRYGRGGGVVMTGASNVVLIQCTVSDHGMMGVNVTDGVGCGVEGSDVANNGDGGVILFGGDRDTLTPSGHFATNCTLHRNQRWIMNYAPNILLGGVGQTARGCEVYASPQIGVFFQGNDHTLSASNVHDVVRQCSDCGAFYMGRDWTYRGNQILGTTFSALASVFAGWLPSAVYLDDQLSSVNIAQCTFDHVKGSLLELGGGRHNSFVENKLIGDANLHMDNRGGDGTKCVVPGRAPYMFLSRVPYQSPPWAKYPGLASILTDDPCTPKHNVISNNVLCEGAAISLNPAQVAAWGSTMANNTKGQC